MASVNLICCLDDITVTLQSDWPSSERAVNLVG